jgi:MinD-like ATPase involved in chromosome partitioning or flagellar assembly
MKLPILSAADGAAWEERLMSAFDRGSLPVEIVRRCVDVVDLLAVATAGQGRVALVAASLRRLDADAVERLHLAGVVAVGVVTRDDVLAEAAMRAVGVRHIVAAEAEPQVVATVLSEAVRAGGRPSDRASDPGADPARHAFADPSASMPIPPGEAPLPVLEPDRHGSVVAVWGPTGAPGRTTVAVTLADELARAGAGSLLIDADVYGGTIAAVLGLLDESPGLAAACRQAAGPRFDPRALAALCWQLGPQSRVLTGVPLASRWPEVRPAAVPAVLGAARGLADFTVVDCAFCLETDEELSFDTVAPRRNGATLAVLDAADLIVVVGAADPIGMQRLVRGLAELRDTDVAAPLWVVLNRVRTGVVPGDPVGELTAALERFAGFAPAALLPDDPRSLDAALAGGRVLGESNPASPLRRAVAELAAALAGVPSTRVGRRRRR